MTFCRHGGRPRAVARTLALSLCAAALFSGALFAQSPARDSQFRDARRLEPAANKDGKAPSAKNGVVLADLREPKSTAKNAKIRSVSADSSGSAKRAAKRTGVAPASAVAAQSLNENLLATDGAFNDVCPDPNDMPSILDVPYKVLIPTSNVPESCPLPDEPFQRKAPTPVTFTWKASSLCYKPLYFEDVQLERYGHYCHPLLQPALSRVRFWLTVPCLPYLIGVDPPNQCVYDLGYYRPGNCAPSMLEPIPISLRGGLLEAGSVVGAVVLIP